MVRSGAIIYIYKKTKDPSTAQIKLELFFGVWVFLLEAGWIIYGNTFIYSDEIKGCEAELTSLIGGD